MKLFKIARRLPATVPPFGWNSLLAIILFALVALAQPVAKRPLNHRDYDGWRTIQNQILSRDGKFLAYGLFPEEGDGELVVRNLATNAEHRESIGALPPAPERPNLEVPAAEETARRGVHPIFTHDGRFLVANTFPPKAETDKARKERKRPDHMPHGGLVIIDLASFSATRVADVSSFQVPEKGASWVAILKTAKPETPAAEAKPDGNNDEDSAEADQRRGGGQTQAAGGSRNSHDYGSDMILRDLTKGESSDRSFPDVLEYSFAKDGHTLLYAVSSRKEETNGLYSASPGADSAPVALLAGKGKYAKLTWDREQNQIAFLSDHDEPGARPPKFKLYLWDRKSAAPTEIVSTSTPGFHDSYVILDRTASLGFSREGSRVFLNTMPAAAAARATEAAAEGRRQGQAPAPQAAPGEEKVVADLWRWNDDYVQPMQKVRLQRDRNLSYRAVFHVADKKFVQLTDPTMASILPSDDGRYAIGTDDRAYRRMVDYDGDYTDYYIVDTVTGARKLALEKQRGGGGGGRGRFGGPVTWAPDDRHFLTFKDNHWYSVSVPDGAQVNLTARLGVAFYNEENDSPTAPNAYGTAGWTKDGKFALLYDRYDVWAVSPDGATAHNLTAGVGRRDHVQFRVVRLDLAEEREEEERGIDPEKPLLLRAENIDTRDSGFFTVSSLDGRAEPKKLIMGPKNYRTAGKAFEADVILVTATTFNDPPDLNVTDSTFAQLRKVTEANPQKAHMLWGTGELIDFKNTDGVPLKAALYKPENFDPSKKYPMMVYLYERLSQNVYNFVPPQPGTSIDISYYVSNGYLVLTPDIVYTIGYPGQSALKCVLPAVQAVVDKGFVNENAIGIQGHSWGGYQIAYMLTQTNRFRAAEAGAPVANMTSAYDGIRWGSGLPRQFQYEKTQSRIGGTLWEYPLRFIENSAIFQVDRVQTPLLILHNDGDDAVPWYQGIELFLAMRRLGKEAYLFDYNGEPHGLHKRANQKDYTARMQEFFDHFLKGAPAPEWMQKGIPYLDRDREKEKFNETVYGKTGADHHAANRRE